MWNMFGNELIETNKEITRSENYHLACLPRNAGKSLVLYIRMKKIERLKDLLTNAHYLPKVWCQEEKLKMYKSTLENILNRIEWYQVTWSRVISQQPNSYLTRFLINRSPTHGGLLECNIDRNFLPIMRETKYFEFIEQTIPAQLVPIYGKAGKLANLANKVMFLK